VTGLTTVAAGASILAQTVLALMAVFPLANLGMIAFLVAFRDGVVPLGLLVGLATGYLAALAALVTLDAALLIGRTLSARASTRSPEWFVGVRMPAVRGLSQSGRR
jgi:hypothetical protein